MTRHFCRPQFLVDAGAWNEVIHDNCYRLPDRFSGRDVIVDIGGHIGCFTLACLARGAGKILAYEADPRNFTQLGENMEPFLDRVEIHWNAVWKSGEPPTKLSMHGYEEGNPNTNTGGGTVVLPHTAEGTIPTVSLDEILEPFSYPARLVKLDCEGSEFPILYTATRWDKIQELALEVHHQFNGQFSAAANVPGHENTVTHLAEFLRSKGFPFVTIQLHHSASFLFTLWARRSP